VVGGFDPGGGAGVIRDVATAVALGACSHAIGTAWTEQGEGVHRVEPREPGMVEEALARAIAELRPAAVKIGMAVDIRIAGALMAGLAGFTGPVVVDPVLATSRGGQLWNAPPRELVPLLQRATLTTPNASEAAALTGIAVEHPADAEAAGRALVTDQGVTAALVKGGHLVDDGAVSDILVTARATRRFEHPRTRGSSPRGTGCALATALAVLLGRGAPLESAVQAATLWVAAQIEAARQVGTERHLPF
jgi:hydroxymethylpyrimidine/phosphomethylpyrimidine kinase